MPGITLAKGKNGRYEWSPELQQVYFYRRNKRRPSWEHSLTIPSNTLQKAFELCLTRELNKVY